ncbi:UNVERIFIED_CONTAM: lactose/L-arabinose transport system permease protein [Brevibacillus sp. OAP136]
MEPIKRLRMKSGITPYLFIAPAILLFLIFTVYPVFQSLLLSFQVKKEGQMIFGGLANYARLLNDQLFWASVKNTCIILVVQVPIMTFLALILAVLVNASFIRFRSFFRISLFMPVITALVAYSIVFKIILDDNYGLLNYMLASMGFSRIGWLTDPFWAKVSIILAITWRWTGYNMVIFLAGLQNIPKDMYEAASLDGAGSVRQFFAITVPQMKPVILFSVVLSTIGTLQLFDEPYILTKGGPANATLTITQYLYQQGFKFFDFGYASAISYVLVIMIGVLSYVQMKWAGDKE